MTVTTLQAEDSALRQQFEEDAAAVDSSQITDLLERVQQAGKTTGSAQGRDQLLEILNYWAPIVEEKTGERPETALTVHDPEAEIADDEVADAAPEENEASEEEPTATYIQGEPQDDQPQTLAQLFMTMPLAARILILVIIALILTAIIFWLVVPRSDEPEVDVVGTETAVAALITASAQPTGTNTPTATPRIYIESETAVAESAPVGSPTPIIYVVQQGDTLNSVSRKYGVPVNDIVALNNIYNPNSIPVGQELLIPTPGAGTSIPTTAGTTANATPAALQAETTSSNASSAPTGSELVIRSTQIVPMHIAAGAEYQAIADLTPGTFATIIAKTPDNNWYLIQLEDGFTRGWVPADKTALLYPADPNTIPTTPVP